MTKRYRFLILMLALIITLPVSVLAADSEQNDEQVDVKEIIFHHLGDGYGWEVPFMHQYRIPLPVIVRAEDGTWHTFSSSKLTELIVYKDEKSGKEKHELVPVPYTIHKKDGKSYTFIISHVGNHPGKIVQIFGLTPVEETQVKEQFMTEAKSTGKNIHDIILPGYYYDHETNCYYREYKPWDFSISKNVLALFIAALVVTLIVMSLVKWYKRNGMKAPRKGRGFLELIVEFVYNGVIKSTLGKKAPKFAPYLLTVFFFILTMNLLGLIVIFPGGANLTGNIAITLVLALMTFFVTNVKGTKHYWKEIFWPDVPIWLKFPLPIMQFIEVFGIFTKPAALCVRLFANMMGGHMIVITLVLLIFIFGAFGAAAVGGVTVISIIFTIFMLLLDVLVSFIQAYVFTMLSTIFISLAQEEEHEHEEKNEDLSENNLIQIVEVKK